MAAPTLWKRAAMAFTRSSLSHALFGSLLITGLFVCLSLSVYGTITWHRVTWQRTKAAEWRSTLLSSAATRHDSIAVDPQVYKYYFWSVVNDSVYAVYLNSCSHLGPLTLGPPRGFEYMEPFSAKDLILYGACAAWLAMTAAGGLGAGLRARRLVVNGFDDRRMAAKMVVLASARSVCRVAPMVVLLAPLSWLLAYDSRPEFSLALGRFWPSYWELAIVLFLMCSGVAFHAFYYSWWRSYELINVGGILSCTRCGYPSPAHSRPCPECGHLPTKHALDR